MEIGHVLVTTLRTVTILFHASHLLTLSSQCFQSKSLSTREIHDLTIDKKPTTADTIHSSFLEIEAVGEGGGEGLKKIFPPPLPLPLFLTVDQPRLSPTFRCH